LPVSVCCKISEINKSTYYYKSNGKRVGKLPSQSTYHADGHWVSNASLLEEIHAILQLEFIDYGYRNVAEELKNRGYLINKKKVYRLMKASHLLHRSRKSSLVQRQFVKITSPDFKRPFEIFEMDIKYVYLEEEKRNSYLLTILDVASRYVPVWNLSYTMKSEQVGMLLKQLTEHPLTSVLNPVKELKMIIRTDNGPQFISWETQKIIEQLELKKENIRKGTPQQNGHIESFHSTLQKLVIDRYDLSTLTEAKAVLGRFYETYNEKRIMKSILYKSPKKIIELWQDQKLGIKREQGKSKFFLRERL
jgi:transposase InsO family protein